MAKIPIILEPGRADGKLATSNAIFDENKGMFQSEINDIQDTLTSDNPNKPLSANQGKILKELLDTKVIESGGVPIDTEPTEGNTTNVVNSDGIYKALSKKVNNITFEERNKNQDEKLTELKNKTEVLEFTNNNSINLLDWKKYEGSDIKSYITEINQLKLIVKIGVLADQNVQYTAMMWVGNQPLKNAELYSRPYSTALKNVVGEGANIGNFITIPSNADAVVFYAANQAMLDKVTALGDSPITHIELIPTSVYSSVGITKKFPFAPYDSDRIKRIETSLSQVSDKVENIIINELGNSEDKGISQKIATDNFAKQDAIIEENKNSIGLINKELDFKEYDSINKADWEEWKGKVLYEVITKNNDLILHMPILNNLVEGKQYVAQVWLDGIIDKAGVLLARWYSYEKKNVTTGDAIIGNDITYQAASDGTLPDGICLYSPSDVFLNKIKDASGKKITHIQLIEKEVNDHEGSTQFPYIGGLRSERLANIEESITKLEEREVENKYSTRNNIYGISYNNNTGEVLRIADAVGKNNKYLVGNEYVGETNDFDNIFPWCDIKMCNVKEVDGNKVVTYKGEDDFALDGSNGEVMVEIPKFYSMRTIDGNLDCICISGEKKSGFHLEPMFFDSESGGELDYVYIGRYKATKDTDGVHSKTNSQATCSISLEGFKQASNNNIIDFVTMLGLQKLMSIEFACVDFSRIMGGLSYIPYHGRISSAESVVNSNTLLIQGSNTAYQDTGTSPVDNIWVGMQFAFADWLPNGQTPNFSPLNNRIITSVSPISTDVSGKHQRRITFDGEPITCEVNKKYVYCTPQNSGLTDNMSYHTGRCGLGAQAYGDQFQYRGIEGFIGNCGEMLEGVIVKNLELYYTPDKSKYGDLSKYIKMSYKLPLQNGYRTVVTTKMGYDRKNPLINCPISYEEDAKQETFYGDPIFTYDNVDVEYVGYWGMQLDAGAGNGLYTERFWFKRTDTSPLYGSRLVYRSL